MHLIGNSDNLVVHEDLIKKISFDRPNVNEKILYFNLRNVFVFFFLFVLSSSSSSSVKLHGLVIN